ncbi:MAG: hypothetical protein GY832_26130 [Chloroflexi bacterium]|nr:hypothetical protein [Chloroflexota bacterium]
MEGELPTPLRATKRPIVITAYEMPEKFQVETLEGTMDGKRGDFLIVGVEGEMYPCDRAIFEKSYTVE